MRAPRAVHCSRRPLWALAPLLWLTGCGFHMQGRVELPRSLASAHIEAADQQSDFYSSLRAELHAAGSQLDGPGTSAATVRILEDNVSERILTVSARNTPTAFVLSYRIKVAVDYQGRELLPAEEHTLSREYSFDETQLLAKQRESDILRQALADDLAALVMHRLAAL
jgi:LPS-assembly lipoprotein